MKNVSLIIMMLIFAGIIASCETEKEYNVETRYLFVQNKDIFEQKEDFNLLSDGEQSSLWLSKIEQLKNLKLPHDHLNLISELEIELKNFGYNNLHLSKHFLSITEKLFNEIPSEDIYQMLFTLEDYNFPEEGYHFESGYYSFEPSDFLSKKLRAERPLQTKKGSDCNCRWLCSGSGVYDYHRNCVPTSHGCGLFWLWSCTDKAY